MGYSDKTARNALSQQKESLVKGRLYALSQATFFVDPKLGAYSLWRGLRCPYLLHETSLAAQGPQYGPAQPRQREGGSTKDLMVIRCAAAVRPARRQLLRSEW